MGRQAESKFRQALEIIDRENPEDPRLHITITAFAVALAAQNRGAELAPVGPEPYIETRSVAEQASGADPGGFCHEERLRNGPLGG